MSESNQPDGDRPPSDWGSSSAAGFLPPDQPAAPVEGAPAGTPVAAVGAAPSEPPPAPAERGQEAARDDGLDADFAQLPSSGGPDLVDCGRCGTLIDPRTAAISGDGPICKVCEAREQARDVGGIGGFGSGWPPLHYGLLSLVCNPLFIPSLLAISGGYTILSTTDKEQARLDHRVRGQRAEAWMAIIFGSVHPLMFLGGVALVLFSFVVSAMSRPRYDDDYDPYAYEDPYGYDDSYDDDYGSDDTLADLGGSGYDPTWADRPVDDGASDDVLSLEEMMRRAEQAEDADRGVVAETVERTASIASLTGTRQYVGPCYVRAETLSGGARNNCHLRVECGADTVYDGDNLCQLSGGAVESARDVGRTVIDGTPALTLDLRQGTARVSDADFNLTLSLD